MEIKEKKLSDLQRVFDHVFLTTTSGNIKWIPWTLPHLCLQIPISLKLSGNYPSAVLAARRSRVIIHSIICTVHYWWITFLCREPFTFSIRNCFCFFLFFQQTASDNPKDIICEHIVISNGLGTRHVWGICYPLRPSMYLQAFY